MYIGAKPLEILKIRSLIIVLLAVVWGVASADGPEGHEGDEVWVLFDSSQDVVQVREGKRVLAEFPGAARGRAGVVADRRRDSKQTPSGTFRIAWTNSSSDFHRFLGLDYPRPEHARRAHDAGDIDVDTYLDIVAATARNQLPPQDTVLGGHIGIHGLGKGNPEIHRNYHWTQGCVALTNEQIDELLEWVQVGTRVVIR